MSANETFILSSIMYSAYVTYDVGKLKLKLREREREYMMEWHKGFISMRLGGCALQKQNWIH